MERDAIAEALDRLQVGRGAVFQNLAVFPLIGGDRQAEPSYLLLDEAIERQLLLIKEVSLLGSVPDLLVTNSADMPILILDGEELVGAKQNRVLNLTVLVPAHRTIQIPVSCVEAGRWAYESVAFRSSPHAQYAMGRAARVAHVTASLKSSGERRSNQVEVWADLEEKAARLGTHSPTGAMMAMYLENAPLVEEYAQAFNAVDGQRGAVFAINGRILGIDLFDHSATLRAVLPKLTRSYALDAIDSSPVGPASSSVSAVRTFLRLLKRADRIQAPAVGLGTDIRIESRAVAGGALFALSGVVHLFGFRQRANARNMAGEGGRMRRASWRRRFRW
jgi:hypothetical protein